MSGKKKTLKRSNGILLLLSMVAAIAFILSMGFGEPVEEPVMAPIVNGLMHSSLCEMDEALIVTAPAQGEHTYNVCTPLNVDTSSISLRRTWDYTKEWFSERGGDAGKLTAYIVLPIEMSDEFRYDFGSGFDDTGRLQVFAYDTEDESFRMEWVPTYSPSTLTWNIESMTPSKSGLYWIVIYLEDVGGGAYVFLEIKWAPILHLEI